MNRFSLMRSSLRHYWRTNAGVLLGAAVASAILIGALVVGDSVRHRVAALALSRVGQTSVALHTPGRLFRAALADELQLDESVAPVLMLAGNAKHPDRGARANGVQVLGVDERFWQLAPRPAAVGVPADGVVINGVLAEQLGAHVGDTVLLRIDKPSALPRDAALATTDDATVAVRVRVSRIIGDARFGRFGMSPTQRPPYNAYLPIEALGELVDAPSRANTLLAGGGEASKMTIDTANAAVAEHWRLADAELQMRPAPNGTTELRSSRVFIDPAVADAVRDRAEGVVTYFVNTLQHGERATPYSMVAATDGDPMPEGAPDDAIIITDWLADDLQVKVGGRVTLRYWVLGPMRQLVERSAEFEVVAIVPQRDARHLMPDLPGLHDAGHCRDWRPGFGIDHDRIRDKDEAYWNDYRGSPKAYIKLAKGRELWANRFGAETSFFFDRADVRGSEILAGVDPAALGLAFQPLRAQALQATKRGTASYFGYLFIGFSFFLIVAALLLTAMLFVFNVEQRAGQVGTLLALGFTPRRVRRLLLGEGVVLAGAGSLIGVVGGLAYTKVVLVGLTTVWHDAVGLSRVQLVASPASLVGGALGSFVVALLVIVWVVRKQAAQPAPQLMAAGASGVDAAPSRRALGSIVTASVCGLAALGLLMAVAFTEGGAQAGAFFGAGAALLACGVSRVAVWLRRSIARPATALNSLAQLGWRSTQRRVGRSVAVVALLACGTFLVVAVGANRHDASHNAYDRASGTGGFALYASSTLPIYDDLRYDEVTHHRAVPLRVGPGDDASCLNLTRAGKPRLLAVDHEALAQRKAFTFVDHLELPEGAHPWALLADGDSNDDAVPAVADQPTLVWGLGKKLGDVIGYTDERGRTFRVKIVGIIGSSILQGHLLIDERAFLDVYPSASGYTMFLIDTDAPQHDAELLSREYEDEGLEVQPVSRRLAQFLAVENTYLSIFQALGGLGLMLGTVGLGIVVGRNILERRGELALLRAVGYTPAAVRRLLVIEHVWLLAIGIAVGLVAALVAVAPAIRHSAELPTGSLAVLLASVFASGLLFIVLAARLALRGPLLDALRSE